IRPYGYAGLGDLSVLIFFGWVAVMGTYFLQTERLDWDVMLPATSCGLLAVAVLNINNIRDRRSDGLAGKNTIPVRLGLQGARIYHWILLLGAILLAIIYVLNFYYSPWQFLFLLTVPLLIANGIQVWRMSAPAELNPLLKKLSITTLLFVLVFSIGQVL
ncbi:MAG: 1,4-dihydroxy-2-naphthoate octaprenyltransferase, partial [Candidatus Promineifilaceae bacterium]